MANRLSRRRAIGWGLALLGGLVMPADWWPRPAAAQVFDPPGAVPWPTPPSPGAPATAPMTAPAPADSGPPRPPAGAASIDGETPVAGVGEESDETEPAAEPPPLAAPVGVPPVKLMIPALGVEAAVEPVGEDPDGAMSAPSDPDDVAWYKLGPGMGVSGNVVFAGHVNWAGRLRAFGNIDRLDPGDAIQVIDAQGRGFEYAVESMHWVRAEGAPLEEIFAQPSEPVVTLISCGGEYVAATREYLDRIIVRARGK
jgi:hypothetical protein